MLTTIFSPFPYLETERLSLWQMEKSDAPDILALRSDDRVNKYIDRKKMVSLAEAEFFIDKINGGMVTGVWIFWSIADKHTKKFLGTVCIWNIDQEESRGELGYELLHDAQGNGYMQEVIPKILDFGFHRMGLKMIEAVIKEGNDRSLRLAEKNGFAYSRQDGENRVYNLAAPPILGESSLFP